MIDLLSTVSNHPLFGIFATVLAYAGASAVWDRYGAPALLHPVPIATAVVVLLLFVTGLSYEAYFQQAALLNDGLKVVIVILAVPLARQAHLIVQSGRPIAFCLVIGSLVAVVSALVLPSALGAGHDLLATLAPKSTTTAVAVELSAGLGGAAGLTAVVVICTGTFGAVFGPTLLDTLGVNDHRAQGFALGVASHAIGTARAFQISDVAGAFASLGMILNALLTIALVPSVLALLTT